MSFVFPAPLLTPRMLLPPAVLLPPSPSFFPLLLSRSPRSSLFPTLRVAEPAMAFHSDAGGVPEEAAPPARRAPPAAPRRAFQIVVAATAQRGIGKDGTIPWKLACDMKFFKGITSFAAAPLGRRNAVVMGRRTWDGIPAKFRPLPGRLNVVLTRRGADLGADAGSESAEEKSTLVCGSLDAALVLLAVPPYDICIETVFVIGGGQVCREAMASPDCDAIHITEIDSSYDCDTFIPCIDQQAFRLWYSSIPAVENHIRHSFATYIRVAASGGEASTHNPPNNGLVSCDAAAAGGSARLPEFILEKHEEYQYLNMIRDIIDNGVEKGDRTGTGTLSKFGCQMRFNLRKYFPLLTTKRVFWRGVVEELLWFISGSTNAKVLQEKDIHIWDGNATREYLDGIGLTDREEGDLGPVYGFQWRHFGAKYTNMHMDYTGQGFDQLMDVIKKIRFDPEDRRIILSAWNPADLQLMALPPCHMFAQFFVANGELSCQMYQRSCDMGLGVPFNIASYALLTCILAHVCDLKPGDFVHVLGDAHVYKNHVKPLKEQLKNLPKPFPVLRINTVRKDIDSLTAADFELMGYQSHKKIPMKMAV